MGVAVNSFNDFSRESWNDYYGRFQPIEKSVLSYDPAAERDKAFSSIDKHVAGSFATAEGALARERAGEGVTPDTAQRVSDSRRLGLARAISSVDSKNRAAQSIKDNSRATQQFAFNQDAFMTDVSGNLFQRAADLENQREMTNGEISAQNKGSLLSGLGKVAGTAYGIYDKYWGKGADAAGTAASAAKGGLSAVGSGAYANDALAEAGFGAAAGLSGLEAFGSGAAANGALAEAGFGAAWKTPALDLGASGAGKAAAGAGSAGGVSLGQAAGVLGGLYSLGTKEGKFAGTASAAMSGYQIGGPWGALIGGIVGYASEGGTKDMNPLDASGFSGITMDKAWQDQNLARLGSNPGAAVASKLGVKSDSVLGKILDPSSLFSKHGDEKRNMKAFQSAFPGISDAGNGKFAMPDGVEVTKDQLQKLAGTWYGATYHPDGDQAGWQQKFTQELTNVYGPLTQQMPTQMPTGPQYTDNSPGWGKPPGG